MKKICIILSIISSLLLILLILLIFFLIKLFEDPTTEDIYKDSQYNVVEVKVYDDSEFVSYVVPDGLFNTLDEIEYDDFEDN